MTELTVKLAQELNLTYAWRKPVRNPETGDVWEFVTEEHLDYDEGNVTSLFVWKLQGTDELWAVDYTNNSWGDYSEINEVYKVEARTKVITVYERA